MRGEGSHLNVRKSPSTVHRMGALPVHLVVGRAAGGMVRLLGALTAGLSAGRTVGRAAWRTAGRTAADCGVRLREPLGRLTVPAFGFPAED